jgi:hypothetical protein
VEYPGSFNKGGAYMRYAIVFVLLSCSVICLSSAVGNGASSDAGAFLKKMFNYANTGNIKALEEMKVEVSGKADKALSLAYSLALYIASPDTYEKQYVEAFPVDFEGIMYDLYEQIELKRLTPVFLYSVVSIGSIAKKGSEKAIEKVFRGYVHSDGAVSALFCDSMKELFLEQSQKTVSALSKIEKGDRQRDYLCLTTMHPTELAELKENIERLMPKASIQERLVIQEIKESTRGPKGHKKP